MGAEMAESRMVPSPAAGVEVSADAGLARLSGGMPFEETTIRYALKQTEIMI